MGHIKKLWKHHEIITIHTPDKNLQVELSVYYDQLLYSPIEIISERLVAPLVRYQALLALPNMPCPAIHNPLRGALHIFQCQETYDKAYYKAYGKKAPGGHTSYASTNHWDSYVYPLYKKYPKHRSILYTIYALEHEFSHGLVGCLFGKYNTQLYPFFTEGIADYLAHGAQCHHITLLARNYGLNHKNRLDIQSIVDLAFSSGTLVYDVGFLLITYMTKHAPLILAKFITALYDNKKKEIIDELLQLFAKNNQKNFESWVIEQSVVYSECPVFFFDKSLLTHLEAVCSHLFKTIQQDNAKIQQFLERHKLNNFDDFQQKIKHFKLEVASISTLQNALDNLQFPIFRILVNNRWLTLESMLQIDTQYREYFEQFTDHYIQALEVNAIAQQVLQLKKYQMTPPLSSLVGLFHYVYSGASHQPTLIELYQTAASFIDLLAKEAVWKQILEENINLRTAIKKTPQPAIPKKSMRYTIDCAFFPKTRHSKPSPPSQAHSIS